MFNLHLTHMEFGRQACCVFLFSIFFFACGGGENKTGEQTGMDDTPPVQVETNAFQGSMEVKTFEVNDTLNRKLQGWGYDIYINGKRAIHQPIIPAIPGNNSFSSEEKARKAGIYA